MTPLVLKYPLDDTGTSPDNLVRGEPHEMVRRQTRAIATLYGGYYAESLVVRDKATGLPLTEDQYYAAEMYQLPTIKYSKMICSVVIITDPSVSDNVEIDYQALGGEYSTSQQALVQMINNLLLDDRPVAWGNIIGKPDRFAPAAHLHDAGDIYGFEYVVYELQRIRAAILMGDVASHDEIYRYIDNVQTELEALIGQGNAALAAHIADKENPHEVTAHDTGAYTQAEVDTLLNQLRTTILGQLVTDTVVLPSGFAATRTAHHRKWIFLSSSGLVTINPNTFQKDDYVIFTNDAVGTNRIVAGGGMDILAPYGQNLTMMGRGATCAVQFLSPTRAVLIGSTQYL